MLLGPPGPTHEQPQAQLRSDGKWTWKGFSQAWHVWPHLPPSGGKVHKTFRVVVYDARQWRLKMQIKASCCSWSEWLEV